MLNYETYIVEIGHRGGRRYARRRPLNVPMELATGKLEELSELQLRELERDLAAERRRRRSERATQGLAAVQGQLEWSPFDALITGEAA